MAEAVSTTPQELAQQQQTQQAEQEHSRVHALDPDFLLVLSFAVLVDAIDIILELTSFLIVPKLLGLVLDAFTLFVLGWWMYWRLGKYKIQNDSNKQLERQGDIRPERLSAAPSENVLCAEGGL